MNHQKTYPDLKIPRLLPFLADAIITLDGCSQKLFKLPEMEKLMVDEFPFSYLPYLELKCKEVERRVRKLEYYRPQNVPKGR
jgi:hypothetical protein